MKRVCVIGGGASGLMAAYASAENGNDVLLLEKNEKLGKKIYITGKGRCNFTNLCSPDEFLENVVHGAKFLTGAVYRFPPKKTVEFFENHGLTVKEERGNRMFPSSDHASDITKTLERACIRAGVEIRLQTTVEKVLFCAETGRVRGVLANGEEIPADVVIVATGGVSYPSTGSTGDGLRFASDLSLKTTPVFPALCGIELKGDFYADLQGLSLKNVSLTAEKDGKKLREEFGEMLFTHFGISGPIVLSVSSIICRENLGQIRLFLDLKPALDEKTLDARILRDFEKYKNRQIVGGLCELLPQKLIFPVLNEAKIAKDKVVNSITKEERTRLVRALKRFPMQPNALCGFDEAIVTSGGVDLSEIDPKTMEAKRVGGLKFCGEVLDLDAFTGGYNLQIAFMSGFVAGNSIN